jgi:large subunit ribosomal protein L15
MVIRKTKRNRKYFGTRRWGLGNIKNGRGAGDRGGVGKGGRKHKWTYVTAKAPETIRKKGFVRWGEQKDDRKEITLREIEKIAKGRTGTEGSTIELTGYKVLSNGELQAKLTIKADAFSKKALEKIKRAGSTAVPYKAAAATPAVETAKKD